MKTWPREGAGLSLKLCGSTGEVFTLMLSLPLPGR
jgi:hypothetical protein